MPPRSTTAMVGLPVAVDAVPGEAHDLGHRRAEVGQGAQRAVAELVAAGPGGSTSRTSGTSSRVSSVREMPTVTVLAWCLMASTGRVSSSMATRERGGQVVDDHGRRADLAVVELVGVERHHAHQRSGTAKPRRTAVRRLEVAVVGADPQAVEEAPGQRLELAGQAAQQRLAVLPAAAVAVTASIAARASRSGRAWPSMASAAS